MQWISVEDQMPPKDNPVIIWVYSPLWREPDKAGWRPDKNGEWVIHPRIYGEITHWAPNSKNYPLPTPPKSPQEPWELCTCDCNNECCCRCGAYNKEDNGTNPA